MEDEAAEGSVERGDPLSPHFVLTEYPFYLINRAAASYNASMERALKHVQMDPPRWRVLMVLGYRDPSTISEIADHAAMKLSTITRVVQRLQVDGLVTTSVKPEDNRVTNVHLTPAGGAALANVKRVASRVYQDAFESVSDAELGLLRELLTRLRRNIVRSR